ncbi:MAG: hypothetical protein AAGE96_01040 [Cyanobacteria bacterium P01_G01_bin.19]
MSETPIVSFFAEPDVVVEEDPGAQFSVNFTVDGEIPTPEFDEDGNLVSGGLSVLFEPSNFAELAGQFGPDVTFDGLVVGPFLDLGEGRNAFEFILTENTAALTQSIFNDIIEEEPVEFNFELLEDTDNLLESNYVVNPDSSTDSFTIEDGNGGPGVGPTVSLSVTETDLEEGDEFTVNFDVDGEIPEGELTVYVDGDFQSLSEFNIFGDEGIDPETDLVGIAGFPEADGDAGGFFATLTENQASITLSVFDDGPGEGPESFIFELIDGEEYEVSSVVTHEFSWTGQIAGFSVEGEFSYDAGQSYEAGIVREDDLLSLDVSFFDPDGNLLRTYTDAQNKDLYPTVNFAFDTATEQILQDGTWDVDDDVNLERNGFMLGEGNPDLRGEVGVQSGLAFWTRPSDDKLPHLHVDDWDDELGFPIGYSTHEDVSFPTLTVADLIDNGKVGETYLDEIQDRLDEFGKPVVAAVSKNGSEGKVELTINDSFVPVFGSVDGDTIEVEGGNQLIFVGDLNDLVDASTGDGGNRIYAGSGDDTLILGASDRILAGEGDDAIFATSGGDNTITGGAGADQFWIATAEIPDAANIITDFTSGEDVIGIAGLGIGFADLSITELEGDALITASSSDLAILQGIASESLTADDFAFA